MPVKGSFLLVLALASLSTTALGVDGGTALYFKSAKAAGTKAVTVNISPLRVPERGRSQMGAILVSGGNVSIDFVESGSKPSVGELAETTANSVSSGAGEFQNRSVAIREGQASFRKIGTVTCEAYENGMVSLGGYTPQRWNGFLNDWETAADAWALLTMSCDGVAYDPELGLDRYNVSHYNFGAYYPVINNWCSLGDTATVCMYLSDITGTDPDYEVAATMDAGDYFCCAATVQ